MVERRDSRLHRARLPLSPEPGSAEEEKVPPPTEALMEHLWKRFGERPTINNLQSSNIQGTTAGEAALEALAMQEGIEMVLNYLDELLYGAAQP